MSPTTRLSVNRCSCEHGQSVSRHPNHHALSAKYSGLDTLIKPSLGTQKTRFLVTSGSHSPTVVETGWWTPSQGVMKLKGDTPESRVEPCYGLSVLDQHLRAHMPERISVW